MLIVLEGIDGGGKTTLAENLVKQAESRGWEGEVWHRGVPERHPLEEYELDLELDYPRDSAGRAKRLIVADRWHMGQLVYGPLYRKDLKDFDLGSAWHVDALLQSLGAVQLILSPPMEVVRQRLGVRGEDYLQEGHYEFVHAAYESMTANCIKTQEHGANWDVGHGVFKRSVTTLREPLDDFDVSVLLDTVSCRSERADALIPFSTYVGPRYPTLLLVGDRHGTGRGSEQIAAGHRAAFTPYSATSGRWLTQAIVKSSLADVQVGIVNSQPDASEELWHTLNRPEVVSLGVDSDIRLTEAGIPHGAVPHPQFARRFHYDDDRKYIQAILAAAIRREKVNPWPR